MAKELGGHPALGAWEIINEYEGSLRVPESNGNVCFDTNVLQNSGAGWTGVSIPMQRLVQTLGCKPVGSFKVQSLSKISTLNNKNHRPMYASNVQ